MAFAVSDGQLAAVDKAPGMAPFPTVRLSEGLVQSYAAIWRSQPQIRTVTSFLARNVAQIGLHCFRRVDDVDRERLTDHPLPGLLNRPTPWTTRYRQIDALMLDLGIYDRAFWVKVAARGQEQPMALQRVAPTKVTLLGDNPFVPDGFRIRGAKGNRDLPADQVVFFRGYNPDDARDGCSPIETLRRVLAEEYAAGQHREQLWRNGARHSGYIRRPLDAPKWSDTAKSRFKREWKSQYTGDGPEAGGTPILEDGMEFASAAVTPEQAQYLEARKLTREEVAAAYHIPPPMIGILDHATFCLPAHALISTDRGPVPIVEVRPGDRVWSVVDGALRTQAVTWSGQTGFKRLLTIRTQNRTLECTDNHPVLTRRRIRVDSSAHPNRRRYRWEHAWIPAGDLTVGDVVVTAGELPEHGTERCPTREMSEGFAEFCGLLLGDGNVMHSNGRLTGVSIARAKHATYMDHYRAVIQEEFHRAAMGSRGTAAARRQEPVTLAESERATRFSSVEAASELDALGLSGTAFTKRVPEWVHQLAPKLRAAFLRGFLDADGSVDKKGRISYSSANETMLRQIRGLCIGLGIPVTNIRCQRGLTRLPNGRQVAIAQWTFTCSDPGENRQIGSHDTRYQERLSSGTAFGEGQQSCYYTYKDRTGRTPIEPPEGCGHARIVSIKRSELEVPVYDLTVDTSHNFVAEGVVVHNSNVREQHKQLYQDTLGPWLQMIAEEIQLQLLPEFADNDRVYIEFNLSAKLAGSFEEEAARLQTATGAPWMTRNEARARQNLPQIDGGDELVTPLNVLTGGQASPSDSAPVDNGKTRGVQVKAAAPASAVDAGERLFAGYFERQGKAIASALGALVADTDKARRAGQVKAAPALDEFWDDDRWDGELAAELYRHNLTTATAAARATLEAAERDPDLYDPARTHAWAAANAMGAAGSVNGATKRRLAELLDEGGTELLGAVAALFADYVKTRARETAQTRVTDLSGFGAQEAARQTGGGSSTKTWRVTSTAPRPSHVAMNGETVGLDDRFSNGAKWPGDSVLSVDELAGCECVLLITFGDD